MQMIYALFFYFLISKVENDAFSVSNVCNYSDTVFMG